MLTLAEDGSTSQARFLAMAAKEEGGEGEGDTVWPIPARVIWEGAGDEEGLVVMLEGGGGAGDDDRELMEKIQELQAAGKWFKVRARVCARQHARTHTRGVLNCRCCVCLQCFHPS